jgi:hypothetical protein
MKVKQPAKGLGARSTLLVAAKKWQSDATTLAVGDHANLRSNYLDKGLRCPHILVTLARCLPCALNCRSQVTAFGRFNSGQDRLGNSRHRPAKLGSCIAVMHSVADHLVSPQRPTVALQETFRAHLRSLPRTAPERF